jgi:hypothetical protein
VGYNGLHSPSAPLSVSPQPFGISPLQVCPLMSKPCALFMAMTHTNNLAAVRIAVFIAFCTALSMRPPCPAALIACLVLSCDSCYASKGCYAWKGPKDQTDQQVDVRGRRLCRLDTRLGRRRAV